MGQDEETVTGTAAHIDVKVDAEAVQKMVVAAILNSALGEQVKKEIDKKVRDFCSGYQSGLGNLVGLELQRVVREVLVEEKLPELRAFVAEKVTDHVTEAIFQRAWESFVRAL